MIFAKKEPFSADFCGVKTYSFCRQKTLSAAILWFTANTPGFGVFVCKLHYESLKIHSKNI